MMLDDAESEMRGDLLIYSSSELERIRTDTYLSIVHTIYYRYYERWQSVVPEVPGSYRKHLDRLYSLIQSELGRKQSIVLNGHKVVLSEPQRKPVMSLHRVTSFSLEALLIVTLLTAAMLGLKRVFNLSNGSFAIVYGLAIVSFIAVAGIVSKNARAIFAELVSLAKHVLRQKNDSKARGPSRPQRKLRPDAGQVREATRLSARFRATSFAAQEQVVGRPAREELRTVGRNDAARMPGFHDPTG